MADEFKMEDALGSPRVLGALYGYSSSQSSRITVVVGIGTKLTAERVTLTIKSRRNFLYGKEYDTSWSTDAKTVSVHPCHLFPIPQCP